MFSIFGKYAEHGTYEIPNWIPIIFFLLFTAIYLIVLRRLADPLTILGIWLFICLITILAFLILRYSRQRLLNSLSKAEKQILAKETPSIFDKTRTKEEIRTSIDIVENLYKPLVFIVIILFGSGLIEISASDSYKEVFLNKVEVNYTTDFEIIVSKHRDLSGGTDISEDEITTYYTNNENLDFFINTISHYIKYGIYTISFLTLLASGSEEQNFGVELIDQISSDLGK